MEKIIKEISLSFEDIASQNTNICLKRNDRYCYSFKFLLPDISSFKDNYAQIRFKLRSSGEVYSDALSNCQATSDGLVILYDVPMALLQRSGVVEGEISIYESNSEARKTSGKFIFKILSDISISDETLGEYAISAFEQMLNQCNELISTHAQKLNEANEVIQRANNSLTATDEALREINEASEGLSAISDLIVSGVTTKISAFGEVIPTDIVENSDLELKVYGNAAQLPIPNLNAPSEIQFIGEDGDNIKILTNSAEMSIDLGNGIQGLRSIPDGNGGYIYDTYDTYSGVLTQRIGQYIFDESTSSNWQLLTSCIGYDVWFYPLNALSNHSSKTGLCNYFPCVNQDEFYDFNCNFDNSIMTFGTPYCKKYDQNEPETGIYVHVSMNEVDGDVSGDFGNWVRKKALENKPLCIYFPLETPIVRAFTPSSEKRVIYTGKTNILGNPMPTSPCEFEFITVYNEYTEIAIPTLRSICDKDGNVLISDEYDFASGELTRNVGFITLLSSDLYDSEPIISTLPNENDEYSYNVGFIYGKTPCMSNYFLGLSNEEFNNFEFTGRDIITMTCDDFNNVLSLSCYKYDTEKKNICENFGEFCDSKAISDNPVTVYYKLRRPSKSYQAQISIKATQNMRILADTKLPLKVDLSYKKDFAAAVEDGLGK